MSGWAVVGIALAALPPVPLHSQLSVRAAAGARYSTSLVHDSIVVPIDLRAAIAPALRLELRDDFPGPWAADAELEVSHTGLRRAEDDSSVSIGSFTNVALTLGLRHDVGHDLAARLGVGGLVYTAHQSGVFARGSGGVSPLLAAGVSYAPRFGGSRALELGVQYDLHRFLTPALRDAGFNHPHVVHRLAVMVSARVLGTGR